MRCRGLLKAWPGKTILHEGHPVGRAVSRSGAHYGSGRMSICQVTLPALPQNQRAIATQNDPNNTGRDHPCPIHGSVPHRRYGRCAWPRCSSSAPIVSSPPIWKTWNGGTRFESMENTCALPGPFTASIVSFITSTSTGQRHVRWDVRIYWIRRNSWNLCLEIGRFSHPVLKSRAKLGSSPASAVVPRTTPPAARQNALLYGGISSPRREYPVLSLRTPSVISSEARNPSPPSKRNARFLLTTFVEMTSCAFKWNTLRSCISSQREIFPRCLCCPLSFRVPVSFRAQREIFPYRPGGTEISPHCVRRNDTFFRNGVTADSPHRVRRNGSMF